MLPAANIATEIGTRTAMKSSIRPKMMSVNVKALMLHFLYFLLRRRRQSRNRLAKVQ